MINPTPLEAAANTLSEECDQRNMELCHWGPAYYKPVAEKTIRAFLRAVPAVELARAIYKSDESYIGSMEDCERAGNAVMRKLLMFAKKDKP